MRVSVALLAGVVAWGAVAAGCGTSNQMPVDGGVDGPGGPVPVKLSGAVQKGPFVLGSTVNVSTVDAAGNPTGQVFPTQTSDDLGDFSLNITYQGNVSLDGTGFYYNEATGKLSGANLTLRAFYDVTASGTQSAYINIVTHLTNQRIRTLLAASPPPTLADAVAQAETELRTALTIGGVGFDPMAAGIDMNVAGGDNDANAYLFAVSAVLAEIAVKTSNGASVDATLQQLIDTTSASFATSGTLSLGLVQQIHQAQIENDPNQIMDRFAARLTQIGSTAVVPDLNRVWDTDGDGIPNAADNCPLIANPTQQTVQGLCSVKRTTTNFPVPPPSASFVTVGDFTGDGFDDVLLGSTSLSVYASDGHGNLAVGAPITTALAGSVYQCVANTPSCYEPGPNLQSLDVDGDGNIDLIGSVIGTSGTTVVFYGDGTGHFGTPVTVAMPIPYQATTLQRFNYYAIADFDNDGHKDFIGSIGVFNEQVWVAMGNSARGWAAPTQVSFGSSAIKVGGIAVGDFTGDGKPDVIINSTNDVSGSNLVGGLFLLTNDGTTGTTFSGFTVGAPFNAAGTDLYDVLPADVNGDHKLDLVVDDNNGFVPIIGDGTGGFTVGTRASTVIGSAGSLVVGDFTGDGKDDVVNLNFSGGVVFGISDGSGFALTTLPYLVFYGSMHRARLNSDATPDLLLYGIEPSNVQEMITLLINP